MLAKIRQVVAGPIGQTSVAGIPLLFARPEQRLREWRAQAASLLDSITFDLHDVQTQAQDARLLPSTRDRLASYAKAQEDNLGRLKELLGPLGPMDAQLRAAHRPLPPTGGPSPLITQYTNLLRDWAWTTDENQRHMAEVEKVLPSDRTLRKVLVLGAGGCRLAYDLARRLRPEVLVATEINPLLFLVAKRVLSGERVSLWEFPSLPLEIDRCHRLRELVVPEPGAELELVFQDFLEPSFRDQAFDLVVTPWFIDVISAPMAAIIGRINQLLRVGGLWLNFGPMMIRTATRAALLTEEEVLLLAQTLGFAIENQSRAEVPSLCSDYDHAVIQHVTTSLWVARKTEACSVPLVQEDQVLPPFLLDPSQPISFGVDVGPLVAGHDLFALVLRHAQKGKSANDLVKEVMGRVPADEETIRSLVMKTLRSLYLAQRSNPMRDSG